MRVNMWYWLNTTPEAYAADFALLREMGCDTVCMGFGVNLGMIAEQPEMTLRALDCCQAAGLTATLSVFNPTAMGKVEERFCSVHLNGKPDLKRGNVYDEGWMNESWLPYLTKVAGLYGKHPALRGYLLDDTFSCGDGIVYSYSEGDRKRFQAYLKERYQDLARLNDLWRCSPKVESWETIALPRDPVAQMGAWADWTDARRLWVKNWAQRTVDAMHAVDPVHPVIYTDYDFYWRRSKIAHGAELSDLASIFDEYGIYEAMPKASMPSAAIVDNWKRELAEVRAYAPERPMHALMWLTDVYNFKPMEESTLLQMLLAAKAAGAVESHLYALRVSDWNKPESFQPPYTNLGVTHPLSPVLYPDQLKMLGRVIREVNGA